MIPPLLSADEAAERLGITGQNVRVMCRAGQLPAKQFQGRWVLLADDVERALSERGGPGSRSTRDWAPPPIDDVAPDVLAEASGALRAALTLLPSTSEAAALVRTALNALGCY